MARFELIDPAAATGPAKEVLDGIQAQMGGVPNFFRALASSPKGLAGVLGLLKQLGGGVLARADQERIALAIAEENACEYCVSAHTEMGKSAGLDADDMEAARQGRAADPRSDALVKFARALLDHNGELTTADFTRARDFGLTDAELVEVVIHVGLNVMTNLLGKSGKVDIDFPEVALLERASV